LILLLILVLGVLVVTGVLVLSWNLLKSARPIAETTDPLVEAEEAEFAASVLRKQQQRDTRKAGAPPPADKATPPPDPQTEILWDEREDVYRPAPGDARKFAQALKLDPTPAFKLRQPLIFLRHSAHERMQAHLRSDLTIELGGLLLGQAFYDAALDAYFVVIEEALPADGGEGTAISFEYTSTTWTHLTPKLQQMNPDWTVLGSYHSHPGLGVFLSTIDRETQESVFAQDWQVAIVIDPIKDEIGFFLGEKGKPCPDWYVVENA